MPARPAQEILLRCTLDRERLHIVQACWRRHQTVVYVYEIARFSRNVLVDETRAEIYLGDRTQTPLRGACEALRFSSKYDQGDADGGSAR